jgi:hypothetical protein
MDKVAEFYARWFANTTAQEYWAAEDASEELAKELLAEHAPSDGTIKEASNQVVEVVQ